MPPRTRQPGSTATTSSAIDTSTRRRSSPDRRSHASTPSPASTRQLPPGAQGRRRLAGGEQPPVEPEDRRRVGALGLHGPLGGLGREREPRLGRPPVARRATSTGSAPDSRRARRGRRPGRAAPPRRAGRARRRRRGTGCRGGRAGARRRLGPRPRCRPSGSGGGAGRGCRRPRWAIGRRRRRRRPRTRAMPAPQRPASPHGRCSALNSKARWRRPGPVWAAVRSTRSALMLTISPTPTRWPA